MMARGVGAFSRTILTHFISKNKPRMVTHIVNQIFKFQTFHGVLISIGLFLFKDIWSSLLFSDEETRIIFKTCLITSSIHMMIYMNNPILDSLFR